MLLICPFDSEGFLAYSSWLEVKLLLCVLSSEVHLEVKDLSVIENGIMIIVQMANWVNGEIVEP